MKRLQISINGVLGAVAIAAALLCVLTQPWKEAMAGLLTIAVFVLPAIGVVHCYGPDLWRAKIRSFVSAVLSMIRSLVMPVLLVGCGALALSVCYLAVVALGMLIDVATAGFDPVIGLAVGLTVLVLVGLTRLSVLGSGSRRAFGVGGVLFGWPFLILSLFSAGSDNFPSLITAHALHQVYPYVYLRSYPGPAPAVPTLRPRLGGLSATPGAPDYVRFQRAGHCVISLIAAFAGGLMALRLAERRGRGPAMTEPSHAADVLAFFPTMQPGT